MTNHTNNTKNINTYKTTPGLTVNEDGSLINWLGENYIRQPKPDSDTVTVTWSKDDDEDKWEAVKALLVKGATAVVEGEYEGHHYTVAGEVWGDGIGALVGDRFITLYDAPGSFTSITVTAPDPKAALAKQLEADGWAWVKWVDGGASTYQLVDGEWRSNGDEKFTSYTTTELISIHPNVTRHPAFVAGEAKSGADQTTEPTLKEDEQ